MRILLITLLATAAFAAGLSVTYDPPTTARVTVTCGPVVTATVDACALDADSDLQTCRTVALTPGAAGATICAAALGRWKQAMRFSP